MMLSSIKIGKIIFSVGRQHPIKTKTTKIMKMVFFLQRIIFGLTQPIFIQLFFLSSLEFLPLSTVSTHEVHFNFSLVDIWLQGR